MTADDDRQDLDLFDPRLATAGGTRGSALGGVIGKRRIGTPFSSSGPAG